MSHRQKRWELLAKILKENNLRFFGNVLPHTSPQWHLKLPIIYNQGDGWGFWLYHNKIYLITPLNAIGDDWFPLRSFWKPCDPTQKPPTPTPLRW